MQEELISRLTNLSDEQLALFKKKIEEKILRQRADAGRREAEVENPFAHVRRGGRVPLSFAQQRLWFLDQLEPGNSFYNVPGIFRLQGRLDVGALERALQEITRRHEILRTTFTTRDGEPEQVIHPAQAPPLPLIDLTSLPAPEREREALKVAEAEAKRPFDLGRGPLMRVALVRLEEQLHTLLLTMHHIITDGWSMGVLVREMASLYESFSESRPAALPDLPIQYADFAVWQRERLRGAVLEEQLAYWKGQLGGAQVLELPTDRPRPAVQTFRGAIHAHTIPPALSASLKALGGREKVTDFVTLLAAFQVLLHKYCGQEDISVGTPVANRNRLELEPLIGFFVNTLVLRADLSGDPTFLELLRRVRAVASKAFAHQEVPFEQLVEHLQPERDLSRSPLFQVMLVLQNTPVPPLKHSDLTLSVSEVDSGTSRFDLTFLLTDSPQGFDLRIEYNTDLFDGATVGRMAGHFERLLAAVAAEPERRLSELTLLSEEERRRVLVEFNSTGAGRPLHATAAELFEHQARRSPDAVALVCGDERVSFGQLNRRANRLARYLRREGVGPESLVGVCVPRSVEMVVAVLAVLKAGGAYVPLDASHPAERLLWMMEDAGLRVLVTAGTALADAGRAKGLRVLDVIRERELIEAEDGEDVRNGANAENLAYVIYTSGSTGRPKGVLVRHGGLCNVAEAQIRLLGVGGQDRVLQFASLNFDASIFEMVMAWRAGAALCLVPQDSFPLGRDLQQLLNDYGVTTVTLPPSALATMQADEVPSLSTVTVAGEACPGELVNRWSPGRKFFNLYGPTETTIWATAADCVPGATKPPIGRPIDNTQAYVLDAHQHPLPVGAVGELYLGGAGLARGYLGRPALTAERFIPHPFGTEPGARLYRTGDLARYLPDGQIEFVGRADQQVKVRGFRIELGEVEAVLGRHQAVRDCAVVARGETSDRLSLVAYVVSEAGSGADAGGLRQHLREQLPEYMVPSAYVFLERLPLTPNGKVDRRALPEPGRQSAGSGYVAPRTPVEEALCAIWSEVLGSGRVGVLDDFFELGGHSLLATQVVSKVRERLGVTPSLRSLFESPTLEGFAGKIEELKGGAGEHAGSALDLPAVVPDPARQHLPFPLTDVQQAYWIGRESSFELSNVSAHGYMEFDFQGLDPERLNRALRKVIERHGMLRVVVLPDGQQQMLEHVPPYEVEVIDLRGHAPDEAAGQLEAVRQRMSHQVLAADRWPLFEIVAQLLDGGRVRLHVSLDALIGDALSLQILFGEVTQLYLNADARLKPLELSFRDYVLAEQSLHETELYRRSKDYWLARVPTLPPAPELPLVQNPGALEKPRFVRRSDRLEPHLWSRLKERARRAGVTPSAAVCAAFADVLAYWSKSPRFTINLTLFNRLPLHPQVNDIVGDFTSLTLLSVDASRESFVERARALQEQLWNDLDHRHFSGIGVIRELARARGGIARAAMPVVFTSILTQETRGQSPAPADEGAGAEEADTVYSITQTPQVWLDHQVSEQAGALILNWDAVDALFPEGLLREMFEAYGLLLRALAADDEAWQRPERRLLPPAQLEQRRSYNATDAPLPGGLLHTLFAEQALRTPRQTAVVAPQRTLTYEELYGLSNQLGRRLRQLGARPNTLVAVVMEKGWEQVVAVLGVLASGAAYLPVSATLPKERMWYLLEHGGAELVVTQSWLDESLEWPAGVRRVSVDGEDVRGLDAGPLESRQGPEDLAYVIYTSGSTGLPKGVMIDHRGAVNTILDMNRRFRVTPEDRVLALSSLSFDLSVYDIFGMLAAGATIVMPLPSANRDPSHWTELLVRERVTVWNSVPALAGMLAEYAGRRGQALEGCALRLVLMSGDWIPVDLPSKLRSLIGGVELVSLGGATEASIWSILYPIETVEPSWSSIPYGRPMLNQRFHVLNESLEPCPTWVPGQLYIGGVGVAKGYWRDREKTRASFFHHPRTGELLYRTGDLGRFLPDGNIEFLGREDFQVKIQGHRIELGEIEAALQQHPAVAAAAVKAVGEGRFNKRLVAYVVPETNAEAPGAAAAGGAESFVRGVTLESVTEAGRRVARHAPEGAEGVARDSRYVDRLTTAYICLALTRLGVYTAPGERHSVEALMRRAAILPRYHKLVARWLQSLAEDGLLRREGAFYVNPEPLPADALDSLRESVRRDTGIDGGTLASLARVGEQMTAMLRGEVDPLELFFAGGSWDTAEGIYQFNPAAQYFNGIAGEMVRAVADALPAGRTLRILEAGAGTGATTASILPVLPRGRASYAFTDVSTFFTRQAAEKFREYEFVSYGLLNMEQSPQEQGYEPHGFDLIVAANVLHATRDLKETLAHVKTLLAPGGFLLLLEGTHNARVHMMTLGFLEGWSRFEDERLADNLPLLSADGWRRTLLSNGFTEFAALPEGGSPAEVFGEHVMLARAPEAETASTAGPPSHAARQREGEFRRFLSEKLPDYMVPSAFMFLDALPLSSNGKVDRGALPEPENRGAGAGAAHVAPRNQLERDIASVWQEVLGVEKVGVHDNFFDLGGDSLLMIRAHGGLQERIPDRQISVFEMFRSPTVSALAQSLLRETQERPALQRGQERAAARKGAGRQRRQAGRES